VDGEFGCRSGDPRQGEEVIDGQRGRAKLLGLAKAQVVAAGGQAVGVVVDGFGGV